MYWTVSRDQGDISGDNLIDKIQYGTTHIPSLFDTYIDFSCCYKQFYCDDIFDW
jgi:hypothetical protein